MNKSNSRHGGGRTKEKSIEITYFINNKLLSIFQQKY